MSTYTYTYTYTRAEAVVDQVDVLFAEAGIDENRRGKVCKGVNERWLEAVGLYLEREGKRVYEIEAGINWSAHSDQAELSFSTDLPGWDNNGSPESIILGRRFAGVAADQNLVPRFWVRFALTIRNDPATHQRLCLDVGAQYGGKVPSWKQTPTTKSLRLQDLGEISLAERSAL